MISKLQYVGSASAEASQLNMIQAALEAGVRWIQLRLKNESEENIQAIALQVRAWCNQHQATFILNDFPKIAKEVKADGVHLGQNDMPTKNARQLLGKNAIIGGTANNWGQIIEYAEEGVVDYIGLGPFRFTTTKQKLSPILGLEGYKNIVEQCKKKNITIPIVAIGGIQLEDIKNIMQTGIHGIAVSGLITHAKDKTSILQAIHQQLL